MGRIESFIESRTKENLIQPRNNKDLDGPDHQRGYLNSVNRSNANLPNTKLEPYTCHDDAYLSEKAFNNYNRLDFNEPKTNQLADQLKNQAAGIIDSGERGFPDNEL